MNEDSQLDFLIKKMAQDHRPELPSPDLIWWRAQILKKQAQKERIERPMVIMRMLAVKGCPAVFPARAGGKWRAGGARRLAPVKLVVGVFLAPRGDSFL